MCCNGARRIGKYIVILRLVEISYCNVNIIVTVNNNLEVKQKWNHWPPATQLSSLLTAASRGLMAPFHEAKKK